MNSWTFSGVIHETTLSTSGAIKHIAINRAGHQRNAKGEPVRLSRQSSLRFTVNSGLKLTQDLANSMGNFDVHGFQYTAVTWLVNNNHPLREFETPAFKEMIAYANPEAAEAL
jgi:hypothetical protein